jgi:hypothetical protein
MAGRGNHRCGRRREHGAAYGTAQRCPALNGCKPNLHHGATVSSRAALKAEKERHPFRRQPRRDAASFFVVPW